MLNNFYLIIFKKMNFQTFLISFTLFILASIVYFYFTAWCYLDVSIAHIIINHYYIIALP